MRFELLGFATALIVALTTPCASAGDAVQADVTVHLDRVAPALRLVEVSRFTVPYGAIGFEPAGPERLAVGPVAFDVDRQGAYVVADPVRGMLVRVVPSGGAAAVSSLHPLPLPLSDLAIDSDGWIYVSDLTGHALTALGPSSAKSRLQLPGEGPRLRFVRQGGEVVVRAGSSPIALRRGALTSVTRSVQVRKCNAEAGLLTFAPGDRQIQVEIGGPLASIHVIGVDATGAAFLTVEQFRQRGRLAVDRYVVVIDGGGALKAVLPLTDTPAAHPVRDLVLGPRGALHRMVPTPHGVTFVRWEVRP